MLCVLVPRVAAELPWSSGDGSSFVVNRHPHSSGLACQPQSSLGTRSTGAAMALVVGAGRASPRVDARACGLPEGFAPGRLETRGGCCRAKRASSARRHPISNLFRALLGCTLDLNEAPRCILQMLQVEERAPAVLRAECLRFRDFSGPPRFKYLTKREAQCLLHTEPGAAADCSAVLDPNFSLCRS